MKKVIAFLLVSSSGLLTSCWSDTTGGLSSSGATNWTPSYTKDISSIKKIYTDDPSFNSCMSTAVTNCSFQTIKNSAIEKSDETICNDLSTVDLQNQCKDNIASSNATKNWDIRLCSTATVWSTCYSSVIQSLSVKNNDYTICLTKPDDIGKLKQNWTGSQAQNPEYIKNLKNSCLMSFVMNYLSSKRVWWTGSVNTEEIFSKIDNDNLKNYCLSTSKKQDAISTPSVSSPNNLDKLKNLINKK